MCYKIQLPQRYCNFDQAQLLAIPFTKKCKYDDRFAAVR